MSKNRPVVIGIAGGSGSGKTSVTNSIYEVFKEHSVVVIEQDYYYKDQSHLEFEERLATNYGAEVHQIILMEEKDATK